MSVDISSSDNSVLESITCSSGTDIGKRREENQDSFGVIKNEHYHCYVVADGMGGVQGGAIASKLAIEAFTETVAQGNGIGVEKLSEAIAQANAEIFSKSKGDPGLTGMGTTFVGCAFVGSSMYIMNVGDSRAYRVRNDAITQLTEDHTLVMDLIRAGTITPDQAENHPVSHMLTRSLGPTPEVESDCWVDQYGPAKGDRYLLCSDGLYNMVKDDEILRIVQEGSLEEATQECIRLANERGGTDNITVIVLEIGDACPNSFEDYPSEEMEANRVEDTLEMTINPIDFGVGRSDQECADLGEDATGEPPVIPTEKIDRSEIELGQVDSPSLDEGVDIESISHTAISGSIEIPDELELEADALKATRSRNSRLITGGFISLVVFSVVIVFAYFRGLSSAPPVEVTEVDSTRVVLASQVVSAPVAAKARVARLDVEDANSASGAVIRAPLPTLVDVQQQGAALLEEGAALALTGQLETSEEEISSGEVGDISRRRTALRKHIAKLVENISSFNQPLSGDVGVRLSAVQRETETLKKALEKIRADIDVATRKLAVWYGRQKRLQSTNGINLAGEVSVGSQRVKESKEIFERSSWEYLKEAEILRYNPTDEAQQEKVKRLTLMRKQRMSELSEEVRRAIDDEVGQADHQITELSLKREEIETRISNFKKENEYLKILMGNNPMSKKAKKAELQRELEISKNELQELERLLYSEE
ncbi:Stp1/IreP family PP2C-type Ser/Thr phosphatase [Oligoflexia bacterium]|nr:Stp1/IreP family PP2C-type Ser/Thr phosphatase [Oligoflexia bacterium]